ncbi:ATP-binding protein [Streptomyces longisporoflavus]|uniref:ATP-binding protein n=1 Tax=Streptomyces longisporoflavus TaxID=28044 RepID=A0ABW7QGG5_9ACTN
MSTPPRSREVPPVTLLESRFNQDDLPRLRMLVEQYAGHQGLPEPRRSEFIVALDAVAVNAVEHAGGGGKLILQRSNGHLNCHIHDSGPGFSADVIPERTPELGCDESGRGLWLADLLTDEMRISTGPGGATVTLTVRLP